MPTGMQEWLVRIAGTKTANSYATERDAYENGVKVLTATGHVAEVVHWDGSAWVVVDRVEPEGGQS